MNFRIGFSASSKNGIGTLIDIALNRQIAMSNVGILAIISLPIHEHMIFFDLFMSSLISFSNVLQCKVLLGWVYL